MTFFVAFYSYKGGVGRTLALANTAYSLAARGKRVALIDMDLEAPGLQEYREFAIRGKAPKGFIEYAGHYRKHGKCPPLKGYIHACKESPGTGQLWLMPSGAMSGSYQKQLGDLPWRKLHPEKGTAPFLDGFRCSLQEEFQPDYVLIDSRTGFSDIGGLSTHQLADMVVLVFNLTRSSLEGSVRTYRSFVSPTSKARFLQLVASPVPPLAPTADSVVERRITYAREHMPLGVAYGRTILRIDYNPAMALSEELPIRQPEVFPAAERYEALREAIQRADPEEVFPILEQVSELRIAGNFEGALSRLRSFTESFPRNSEGQLELGNLLLEAGRPEDAIVAFQKACDLAPKLPLMHRRLGEALVAAGRSNEAVEALERAERLGDKSQEIYTAQSRAYAAAGNTVRASETRRTAAMHGLKELEAGPLTTRNPTLLRQEFIDILKRLPPYSGFSAETLWDNTMGSLSLNLGEKIKILSHVLRGELNAQKIVSLFNLFKEEQEKWVDALGPSATEFMNRIATRLVDPTDAEAVLTLMQGDETDAAVAIFASSVGRFHTHRKITLLSDALKSAPNSRKLLEHLGLALLRAAESEVENRLARLQEAERIYERLLEIEPHSDEALFSAGYILRELASLADEMERQPLLEQACLKYKEALIYRPDNHNALNNWGNVLGELANSAKDEDRRALLQEACSKYREALQHKQDKHEAFYNWGNTLSRLADLSESEDQQALLQEACLKYEEALHHKPDKYEALHRWGDTLVRLAGLRNGENRRALLEEACGKYQEALAIKPNAYESLCNWGNTLVRLADLTEYKEREQVLQDACDKYQEAVHHKQNGDDAWDNWSSALLKLYSITTEATRKTTLLLDAKEKAQRANEVKPGSGDYNLACAHSLLGNFEDASTLIEAELARRPHLSSHILADSDLAPLWEARPDLRASISESSTPDAKQQKL